MKIIAMCVLIASVLTTTLAAQQPQQPIRLATDEAVDNISKNMDRLTKSVETLNKG
jgi:hypothetical protein